MTSSSARPSITSVVDVDMTEAAAARVASLTVLDALLVASLVVVVVVVVVVDVIGSSFEARRVKRRINTWP